jgi:hypothetical protein
MLILGIKGSHPRDPWPTPPGPPGGSGLHPLGALASTFQLRIGLIPSMPSASAWGSGARPSLRCSIDGSLNPNLGPLPSFSASQGPGQRQAPQASKARGLPSAAQQAWLPNIVYLDKLIIMVWSNMAFEIVCSAAHLCI